MSNDFTLTREARVFGEAHGSLYMTKHHLDKGTVISIKTVKQKKFGNRNQLVFPLEECEGSQYYLLVRRVFTFH